jgi:hypothetical protein
MVSIQAQPVTIDAHHDSDSLSSSAESSKIVAAICEKEKFELLPNP